jgi:hypothetical protein
MEWTKEERTDLQGCADRHGKDIEARLRFDDGSRVINVSTRRGGDVPRGVAEDITPKDMPDAEDKIEAEIKRQRGVLEQGDPKPVCAPTL